MIVGTNISSKLQRFRASYFRAATIVAFCLITFNFSILYASTAVASSSSKSASSFFNQRYRGWLWFEENKKTAVIQSQKSTEESDTDITPEAAKAEIEQFAKELEDAKYVMLARPTSENVKAYKDKEAQMWKNARVLQDAWDMASFLYPEHHDLIAEPINVHAVKLKRQLDASQQAEVIKEFAKEFDLVLFFKGSCGYCTAFEPVLKNFGDTFDFNVEAITMDGAMSQVFKTANLPDLTGKLGIDAAPTLVAVSKDGKMAFELIKGFVSITELEEHSVKAVKYLKSKGLFVSDKEKGTRGFGEAQDNSEQIGSKIKKLKR